MDSKTLNSWHNVAPGQWERDIDEAEQFYAALAKTWEGTGHTLFAINACAGIFVPLVDHLDVKSLNARLENAIRHAWIKLRYDHPNLVASLEFDPTTKTCKKVYKTPSSSDEVASWLHESFKVVDNGQSGAEFVNADFPLLQYPTLYLVTPPNQELDKKGIRRDLVFHAHHEIIDGMGTFMWLGNLLENIATAIHQTDIPNIKFGDEQTRLSPSLRVAAGIAPTLSPDSLIRLESIKAAHLLARKDVEVIKVPVTDLSTKPGLSKRVAIHLTPQESKAVLVACKSVGVSPTHAFHAGIALALRDLQEKHDAERHARYVSYSLINLRAQCHPPFNTAAYAAAVYHSVSDIPLILDLTIPACSTTNTKQQSAEFVSTIKRVRAFYKSVKLDDNYLNIVPSLFARQTPLYPDTPCEIPAPQSSPSASLSSFGLIDRVIQPKYGDIEVIDPWIMGSEYSTGLGLFLGTWDKIMCLSAAYNTAFHSEDKVASFLESVKRVVLEGFELA